MKYYKKNLNDEQLQKLFATEFSNSLRMDKKIFRGANTAYKQVLVRPSTRTRQSANTANTYTALLDLLPSWEKMPKRSRSLITTTSEYMASSYGDEVYRVYPRNGAKIGICSQQDFWESFPNVREVLDIHTMEDFAIDVKNFIEDLLDTGIPNDVTSERMKTYLNQMDNHITDKVLIKYTPENKNQYINRSLETLARRTLMYKTPNQSWLSFFDSVLDPDKNGFEVRSLEDLGNVPNQRELWTDADCLLLNIKSFTEMS
jgi:hypothetical protein